MPFARLALIATVAFAEPAAAQVTFSDEFKAPGLNLNLWCPCQINMTEAPILFTEDPDEPGDRTARITVDINSLGGNECRKQAPHLECGNLLAAFGLSPYELQTAKPDYAEPLGPSLIDGADPVAPPTIVSVNKYCTEEILQLAQAAGEEGECIQRQELRLQIQHVHVADQPHLYSLRFRMPAVIEDRTSSTRWVTAQWKQEPLSDAYDVLGDGWGPSPFLAQRFDDGVLHVTVQDEHCRCKIASAPLPSGTVEPWSDGTPSYCVSTRPGQEGRLCTPDLTAEYGPFPVLESPIGNWVDMSYRVQASRSGQAMIEVRQGERFIVRVTGKIGYEPQAGEESETKFKVGQYRDYMPFVHAMEIDRVAVELIAP
jgi:hypothetical protein